MYNTQEIAKSYVIYVRKSTDEHGKQIMSTDDQLHHCKKLQNELWLNVIDVIEEFCVRTFKRELGEINFNNLKEFVKKLKYL
jgi:DNA invertase Pin-like site-specific DNA recombinase